MENFEAIKHLWQQASPEPGIAAADVIVIARRHRRAQLLKDAGRILLLLATAVFIALIACYYDSKMITTRIGEACILMAILGIVVLNTRSLQLIMKQVSSGADVTAYLAQLKAYQQRQRFVQTTGISIYFALLSAGMGLYFYELTHNSTWFAALTYGLTGAWIAFNWFFVRPRTIRRQNARIDATISRLEKLSGQLKLEEAFEL